MECNCHGDDQKCFKTPWPYVISIADQILDSPKFTQELFEHILRAMQPQCPYAYRIPSKK